MYEILHATTFTIKWIFQYFVIPSKTMMVGLNTVNILTTHCIAVVQ